MILVWCGLSIKSKLQSQMSPARLECLSYLECVGSRNTYANMSCCRTQLLECSSPWHEFNVVTRPFSLDPVPLGTEVRKYFRIGARMRRKGYQHFLLPYSWKVHHAITFRSTVTSKATSRAADRVKPKRIHQLPTTSQPKLTRKSDTTALIRLFLLFSSSTTSLPHNQSTRPPTLSYE